METGKQLRGNILGALGSNEAFDVCRYLKHQFYVASKLFVNSYMITNVTCIGDVDGSIEVSTSGGIAPYSYLWGNGMLGSVISGLTSGLWKTS